MVVLAILLPVIMKSTDIAGTVTEEAALLIGLRAGTRLCAAAETVCVRQSDQDYYELLAESAPGSNGLIFLPYLIGELSQYRK